MSINFIDAITAGSISGMVAILFCHPIDVLRTKLQIPGKGAAYPKMLPRSVIHTSLNFIRQNGILSLYCGFWMPFCAQAFYKSVIFSTNTLSNQFLSGRNMNNEGKIFISGFLAGSINAAFVSPVEIIRTRQIILQTVESNSSGGQLLEAIKLIYAEGGKYGFWRSFYPTILRDGPGIALYLLIFDLTKASFVNRLPLRHDSVTIGAPHCPLEIRIAAGSFAGLAYWMWALPIDAMKTIIESEYRPITSLKSSIINRNFSIRSSNSNIPSFLAVFGDSTLLWNTLRLNGFSWLYRAWPFAVMRGIPSAAITLTTYDLLCEHLLHLKS